jgi:hypothetical protein
MVNAFSMCLYSRLRFLEHGKHAPGDHEATEDMSQL